MTAKLPPWLDPDVLRQAAEAAKVMAQVGPVIQEAMQRGVREFQQRASEAMSAIPQTIQAALAEVVRHGPEIEEALRRWNQWIDNLDPAVRSALTLLGMNGWYVDEDMDFEQILVFAGRFKDGDADRAHGELSAYFKGRAEGILASLIARYPNRERFFRAAFRAHSRGEYEVSIPVLLAQADGIAQDKLGVQLYGRNRGDGSLKTAEHAKEGDALDRAMKLPFLSPFPILYNVSEREDAEQKGWSGYLNRHLVLHGSDLEYPTELNGYRAISWLGYVAHMLHDVQVDPASKS